MKVRFMKNHNIATLIFGTLTAILLIGQRFGFAWAGGEGYARPAAVTVAAVSGDVGIDRAGSTRPAAETGSLRRGETVRTGGGRAAIRIGANMKLFLDERTDLTLERLDQDGVSVRLARGRMFATTGGEKQRLNVMTNFTESSLLKGELSIVNYDFRETVSVIPIRNAAVTVVRQPEQGTVTQLPVDIHETDPVTITETTFNSDEGAAKDFYAWVREQTGLLF